MTIYDDFTRAAKIVDLTIAALNEQNRDSGESVDYRQISSWRREIKEIIAEIGAAPHLKELKETLNLDQKAVALLLLAALPYHNVHYKRSYAMLNGDMNQNFPTLNLLLSLISENWTEQQESMRSILDDNPLIYWRFFYIVDSHRDFFGSQLCVPSDIMHFLLNSVSLESDCNSCVYRVPYPEHRIIPYDASEEYFNDPSRLMALIGSQGTGRKTQALYLSGDIPLYSLNYKRLDLFDEPLAVMKDIMRLLMVKKANLYCSHGQEELFNSKGMGEIFQKWMMLNAGKIFFGETDTVKWPGLLNPYNPLSLDLGHFDVVKNHELWTSLVKYYLGDDRVDEGVDWQQLSENYHMSPAMIHRVCSRLVQDFDDGYKITYEDIVEICMNMMQAGLSDLAVRHIGRKTMADMVLIPGVKEQLEEIILLTSYAPYLQFMGLKDSRGIQVLFWGPSGTGKTLAAEVIANELKRPLYKADLSNIASKWIGETEKHLARLFDEAEQNNGVLFFDEADSVFGKRSGIESSHDKNANMGVSYLLQRMESYQGILILATNFKGNMDDAFLRRLQQSVEFPAPGKEERLALWKMIWSPTLPVDPSVNLEGLAELFEITGANIKNIAALATVMALKDQSDTVKRVHIIRGIHREFQKLDNSYRAEQLIDQWPEGRENPDDNPAKPGDGGDNPDKPDEEERCRYCNCPYGKHYRFCPEHIDNQGCPNDNHACPGGDNHDNCCPYCYMINGEHHIFCPNHEDNPDVDDDDDDEDTRCIYCKRLYGQHYNFCPEYDDDDDDDDDDEGDD